MHSSRSWNSRTLSNGRCCQTFGNSRSMAAKLPSMCFDSCRSCVGHSFKSSPLKLHCLATQSKAKAKSSTTTSTRCSGKWETYFQECASSALTCGQGVPTSLRRRYWKARCTNSPISPLFAAGPSSSSKMGLYTILARCLLWRTSFSSPATNPGDLVSRMRRSRYLRGSERTCFRSSVS